MKKPSLRFRQVFEHPTHFKVAKPLGNPLIIAKKGLSPSLQGRLRKFAEGGDVTEPVDEESEISTPRYRPQPERGSGRYRPQPERGSGRYRPMPSLSAMMDELESARYSPPVVGDEAMQALESARSSVDPEAHSVSMQAALQEMANAPADTSTFDSGMASRGSASSGEGLDVAVSKTMPAVPKDVVVASPSTEEAEETPTRPRPRPELGSGRPRPRPELGSGRPRPRREFATVAPDDELEIPEPAFVPSLRGSELGVGAVQPATPVAAAGVVPEVAPVALQPAPVLPSPEERAKKLADDLIEAKKGAQAEIELAQADLQKEQQKVEAEREDRAKEYYNQKVLALNQALEDERKAKEAKPMTAGDVARSIGNAISVAMGAFATGMTGMPNFALQIYNAGVDEALKRAREDRTSAYNKTIQLGLDVKDADALFRAQQDKTLALGLQQKAATVANAQAKASLLNESQKILLDARKAEAEIAKNLAAASRDEAEAAGVKPKLENEAMEIRRKAVQDYMDAVNDAQRIKVTDQASYREFLAKMDKASKDFEADMAKIKQQQPAADMGAPIPGFLKGATDKEIREHRIEYDVPTRDSSGQVVDQRRVGFLVDPQTRKDFLDRSSGFSIAKRQAEELRDWAIRNPTGLAGIGIKEGVSKANQERERLEPLVKTMTEGYIKNVTGIRRASSAAIKYMEGVVKDPSKLKEFINLYLGGSSARFNEIIKEIEAGEADMRNKYIAGGVALSPENEPGRGIPGRRAGE